MSTIDDRIAEARALAARFGPVAMSSAVPGREDFHKLCILMREALLWIKQQDERHERVVPVRKQ